MRTILHLLTIVALISVIITCGDSERPTGTSTSSASQGTIRLNGAGATFPFPLYSKWFDEYVNVSNAQINYQSIGSGGGVRQIIEGTVDFGASDGIMSEEEEKKAEQAHGFILHIPTTIGAVAIVYNLPADLEIRLRLTPDILADIYLKKITKWNDPRLVQINPGLNLPDQVIAVVHRADGSGTTFIFTDYLSKVSQEWNDTIGNATAVNWPGDIGGQGNEGVAGQVRQIPGSIGYVELAYATQSNMDWASVKNSAGTFVEPSLRATSLAAQGIELPNDMKITITNSSNLQSYPISGFTWLLVYQEQDDCNKGKALVDMLWWAIHEGQLYTSPLEYAPLPADAVNKAENQIRSITCDGQPLWSK